jgi:hypothetical protein
LTKAYGGREGWVDKARQLIQTLWEEEYRDLPIQWQLADSNLPVAVRARESNPFDSFQDELMSYSTSEKEPISDEFKRRLSTKQDIYTKHGNPLRYCSAKRFDYPRVARMVIDVLSIPPMAAECERTFSAAGNTLSPKCKYYFCCSDSQVLAESGAVGRLRRIVEGDGRQHGSNNGLLVVVFW